MQIDIQKNLTGLHHKILKMICKILTQYKSCHEERAQTFFERGGLENVPLAHHCFVSVEGTIFLERVRGHASQEKFAKIHLNIRDISAF